VPGRELALGGPHPGLGRKPPARVLGHNVWFTRRIGGTGRDRDRRALAVILRKPESWLDGARGAALIGWLDGCQRRPYSPATRLDTIHVTQAAARSVREFIPNGTVRRAA